MSNIISDQEQIIIDQKINQINDEENSYFSLNSKYKYIPKGQIDNNISFEVFEQVNTSGEAGYFIIINKTLDNDIYQKRIGWGISEIYNSSWEKLDLEV